MNDTEDGFDQISDTAVETPASITHHDKAKRFVELTGLAALPDAMIANVVEHFRSNGAPEGTLKIIQGALTEKKDDILERFVSIHAKNLPSDVLDALIAYQESPAGRMLVGEVGMKIQQEVVEAGDAWQSSVMDSIKDKVAT